MKKTFFFLILFNTILWSNQSVLILNSYHKGYEFSDSIVNAIEKEFYKKPQLYTNILYMDAKRITTKVYYKNLKNLYKVQLKDRKYDLIIAIDRFAYDFILENYHNFFKETPILAVGIENFSKQKADDYGVRNISVLLEKRDLNANIRLIEKAIPKLKNLYIINDKSLNAQHTEPLIQEAIKEHKKNYNLIYLRANNLKELQHKFSVFDENSAILFVRFYKNTDGKLNKNQEISSFIKNSKLPVFITDSIFMKKGALGGRIIDLESFGVSASQMAFDILNKKKNQIKISTDLFYVFDEQKVKEFLIFPMRLAKEYKMVNKSLTFYDRHEGLITFVFMISPLLLFLILGLIHNIYMRKRIEKTLRQRIKFDAILLNAIESPIFWQNEKGVIVDANSMFCDLLQLKYEEIYGNSLELLPPLKSVQRVMEILQKYKKDGKEKHEFRIINEDSSQKVYLVKQTTYSDKKTKSKGWVTLFSDVTKQREEEVEKQKNKQFIIQQSKLAEIGEVFSSIAHQWKSPLVEITTIAQELFYKKKSDDVKEDESFVRDIITQVNYMTVTINDFQKFIMPSNAKVKFDIYEAIKSILKIINHNIKYNNIKVSIVVEEGTCLFVNGYKNEFMQSFLNIINNAKDALAKNTYKNRKIDITLYNDKNDLLIEILDNAGGIESENISKIFNPYYSTKEGGHGIGLYMSRMIIEDKMGGSLTCENKKAGACFKIKLGHHCENINIRR